MNFLCVRIPLPNKYTILDYNPFHIDKTLICDYCHFTAYNNFQEASENEA